MTTADLVQHILNQLADVRVRYPELRFGQLIAMIGMLAEDETGQSLWDVEDGDFAAAKALVSPGENGSNVGATKEPGEPDHAGDPGGASVWYTWTAPADGVADVRLHAPDDTCDRLGHRPLAGDPSGADGLVDAHSRIQRQGESLCRSDVVL